GFFALTHVNLGFDPEHILYVRVAPGAPHDRDNADAERKILFEQVRRRVQSLPGVRTAAISLGLPPLGGAGSEITILGKPSSQHWAFMVDLCSETYFQTFGLRLVQGRLLSESDIESAHRVAVVNQAFVRAFFGKDDPVGQKIKFNFFDEMPETPHDTYF